MFVYFNIIATKMKALAFPQFAHLTNDLTFKINRQMVLKVSNTITTSKRLGVLKIAVNYMYNTQTILFFLMKVEINYENKQWNEWVDIFIFKDCEVFGQILISCSKKCSKRILLQKEFFDSENHNSREQPIEYLNFAIDDFFRRTFYQKQFVIVQSLLIDLFLKVDQIEQGNIMGRVPRKN
ncbi:unnamed protein product [Paramecium octaurelia]|uniref:Uncharacterized protein n=1 Tax=Paramecium octaurelia TaxID=43137 RepID=A0A8S1YLS4_PAROT|nr:unnamed protein product [Paramecium octaurelia]